jgi:hypothetical protein
MKPTLAEPSARERDSDATDKRAPICRRDGYILQGGKK